MFKLIYTVGIEHRETELAWLKTQGIYPSHETGFTRSGDMCVRFGMIISEKEATLVRLRQAIDMQVIYARK